MKRLIGLVLLTLLLCGCTVQTEPETTAALTAEATLPTLPQGLYEPGSELEQATGGAVRSYPLTVADSYGMLLRGGDVLLFSGTDTTTLTRLSGDTLFPTARTELGCLLFPEDPTFHAGSNGITFYDEANREVVFLDNDLKEVRRLGMPEDMVGIPALSADRLKLYYCTEDAVRVYDLETDLDKLLKSVSYPAQSIRETLLNDTVLHCSLTDSTGLEYSVFLSVETGELLENARYGLSLTTESDMYYAMTPEGILNVLLFGKVGEETRMLIPEDPFADAWFLPETNAAVTVSYGKTGNTVCYYDLSSGRRTAAMEIPAQCRLWHLDADPETGYVYLMCGRGAEHPVLFRWDPAGTPCDDETVYTGPRYTLENPNEEGLAQCNAYAAAIGEAHGVQIMVGMDAVANEPWDYVLEPEYQVPVIMRELTRLEELLGNFPQGFFDMIYGTKRICLVRSITGSASSGSLEQAGGIQYWDGNTAYVSMVAGSNLEESFFHEMFHVIDSKVLSDSRAYYYWHNLNPQEFTYFEDYTSYLHQNDPQYLQDETRAFIDAYSMSYAKEDRARIMEYACTEGNAHYFQSAIMQKKLKTLCEGIRDAFRLEQYPEPFLWEQYLETPLTP